jgi:protein-disulfide isomerase
MRQERERAEARRTRLITGSIVAAVIAVVVATGVALAYNGRPGNAQAPDGATGDYGFAYSADTIGDQTASSTTPVRVVFYEDFQCPVCKAWESDVGSYVDQQVKAGALSVEYRPIAILDRASTTHYSTRAANAAACVFDDAGVAAFHTFHGLLYQDQPPEGSSGLPDSELATLAEKAGATDVTSCISGGHYEDWVANATDQASQDNVSGTPTILVDGQVLTGADGGVPTLQDFINAVTAARTGG